MYQKTTLENGLRVATSTMPHTHSVSITIFIGAGSRYEEAEEAGVSHFIEHLCFKGTERRAMSRDISEAIESVGGLLNGATDKELTVYWAKVAHPHFLLALDVLVDMLRHSKFDPVEIEKERRVIIEELNQTLDSPHQRVGVLIDEVVWPNQPLGRDVAGSKETVNSISREAMLDYQAHQYAPGNTVVAVAGDISHEQVVAGVSEAFAGWSQTVPKSWYPADNGQQTPCLRLEQRKTEQAHLCLAVRGLSLFHPDRFTLDLLNVILGEGMSSRLFLEVREKRGLAYDIHSSVSHFLDSGDIAIYAGVDPKKVEVTLEAVLGELHRLKEEKVPEMELTKAREYSKGRMLLRLEDTRSVSSWLGGQELLTGRIRTVDEVISIVDAITPEDIQRVARKLLITEKLNLALVGPFRGDKRLQNLLKL